MDALERRRRNAQALERQAENARLVAEAKAGQQQADMDILDAIADGYDTHPREEQIAALAKILRRHFNGEGL